MEALLCCLVFSLILPLSWLEAHTSYKNCISPYSLEFLKQRVQGQDLDPQLTPLPLFTGYRRTASSFCPQGKDTARAPGLVK